MRSKKLINQLFLILCIALINTPGIAFQVEYIMSDTPKYTEPGFVSLERLITIPNISEDGEKEYYFRFSSDVTVDAESNIYILGYLNRENYILKFDKTGKFITEFASHGQGPNELNNPLLMQMYDGNFYIYERFIGIKVLDINGQYVNSLRYANGRMEWFHISRNSLLYLLSNFQPNFEREILSFYNANLTTKEVIKVLEYIEPENKIAYSLPALTAAANSNNELFFAPNGDEYKIKKYDSNGKLFLEFGRKYKRQEFSNETKKSFNESRGQLVREGKSPPLNKYTPVVRNIFVDNRDLIWVRVGEWSLDFSKPHIIETVDIFTSEGEFLYTFKTDELGLSSRTINDKLYSNHIPDEDENHEITVSQITYLNKN